MWAASIRPCFSSCLHQQRPRKRRWRTRRESVSRVCYSTLVLYSTALVFRRGARAKGPRVANTTIFFFFFFHVVCTSRERKKKKSFPFHAQLKVARNRFDKKRRKQFSSLYYVIRSCCWRPSRLVYFFWARSVSCPSSREVFQGDSHRLHIHTHRK